MIHIAICDDEEGMVQRIGSIVQDFSESQNTPVLVTKYMDSRMLWYDIEDGTAFDILLLDIEMPGLTGMELAGRIRRFLPDVYLVFISAYDKYVIDSFTYQTFRFIPKQEMEQRLPAALESISRDMSYQAQRFFVIHDGRQVERVALQRIITIRKDGKYAIFTIINGHEEDGRPIYAEARVREPLRSIYQQLPQEDFGMVNQVICNYSHIRRIMDDTVEMTNGEHLTIARGKIRGLKEKYMGFCVRETRRR